MKNIQIRHSFEKPFLHLFGITDQYRNPDLAHGQIQILSGNHGNLFSAVRLYENYLIVFVWNVDRVLFVPCSCGNASQYLRICRTP